MIGAVLHSLHGGFNLGNRRDHDHFDEAVVFLDDAEDFETADPRKAHVEQNQVDVFTVENRQRGFAAGDPQHAILALENRRQRVAHTLIVVDNEDRLRFLSHSNQKSYRPNRRIVSGG